MRGHESFRPNDSESINSHEGRGTGSQISYLPNFFGHFSLLPKPFLSPLSSTPGSSPVVFYFSTRGKRKARGGMTGFLFLSVLCIRALKNRRRLGTSQHQLLSAFGLGLVQLLRLSQNSQKQKNYEPVGNPIHSLTLH